MAVIEVCAGYMYHLGDQVPPDWAVCGGAALGALGVCAGRAEGKAQLSCSAGSSGCVSVQGRKESSALLP